MASGTRSQASLNSMAGNGTIPTPPVANVNQSDNLRLRQSTSTRGLANDTSSTHSRRSTRSSAPDEPPRFVIDLSLPPEQRYLEVCAAFKSEMVNLTSLFDEVVGDMVHFLPNKWLHSICRMFLRGVYSKEENAELRGISKAVGVDMYLLVCFNVLLDLFMGCSSGGAVVRGGADIHSESKMVHFRTLDWGMDPLRRIVVQLDYVLEKDGPVTASSITYAGFVGVLTGVRKDLSMSLNFRPNRIDNGKFWADAKYAWHLFMVLLGKRPSISTHLRQFLLPQREKRRLISWLPFKKEGKMSTPGYSDVIKKIGNGEGKSKPITTTACYLCFSDGQETTVIEKDRISATVRTSGGFILVTNDDNDADANTTEDKKDHATFDAAMQEIVDEAKDRRRCAHNNWSNMRFTKLKQEGLNLAYNGEDLRSLMDVDDVVEMVQKFPTTNECTHFACVMDPAEGRVRWCRRWMQPVSAKWVREHMSDTW